MNKEGCSDSGENPYANGDYGYKDVDYDYRFMIMITILKVDMMKTETG